MQMMQGEGLPSVSIYASDSDATETTPEGQDDGQFTITRSGGDTSQSLVVCYYLNGTADYDDDYTLSPAGSVTIGAGNMSATITVRPTDDGLVESDETVELAISYSPSDYAISGSSTATVTIHDHSLVAVSVNADDAEATEGQDTGSFVISRDQSPPYSLVVSYSLGGSAGGGDYGASPAGGSVTIPAGLSSATVTLTPTDDSEIEPDETVELTLASGQGYYVSGSTSATVTIHDNDRPTVTVYAADAEAAESGQDPGSFVVSRNGGLWQDLTVLYGLGGTASESDYSASPGNSSVTIPTGSTSATVTITPVDDSEPEDDETVELTLSESSGYTRGGALTGTVTIEDNDIPTVTVSASDAEAKETKAGEQADTGTFTVSRTTGTWQALTVWYWLTGTADYGAGNDYTASPGGQSTSVTIPASGYSATVTISPVDDTLVEDDETVVLNLASASGYTPGSPSTATVTIEDNDVTVSVTASDDEAWETDPEGEDNGEFVISRNGATAQSLTVYYTMSGTADEGYDYYTRAGTVEIPANEYSVTVILPPINDGEVEDDETAILTITETLDYKASQSSSSDTVTIKDNDPTVDLDTDSNNDGTIDPVNGATGTDDPIEYDSDKPGRVVGVNTHETAGALAEVDLRSIDLSGLSTSGMLLKLTASSHIKVWADTSRTQLICGEGQTKTWTVSGTSASSAVYYVEGVSAGGATLTYVLEGGQLSVPAWDGVRFTVVDVDADTDSNNNGAIDPVNGPTGTDDKIEADIDKPGRIVALNGARARVDLKVALGGASASLFYAMLNGDSEVIKVWDSETGGNEIALGGLLTLDSNGVTPSTVWVAGLAIGTAELKLQLTLSGTPRIFEDPVNLTVIDVGLTVWNGGHDLDNGQATGPDGAVVADNQEESEGAIPSCKLGRRRRGRTDERRREFFATAGAGPHGNLGLERRQSGETQARAEPAVVAEEQRHCGA